MKRNTRKPITVVSVDWDYFLPREIDSFDWGHSEDGNPIYYEFIWPIRADNRSMRKDSDGRTAFDLIQVDPARVKGFWDRLLAPLYPSYICLAESHKDIVQWLDSCPFKTPWNIINFDAHHDVRYDQKRTGSVAKLHCGNWVQWLRDHNQLARYTLVYPEWRKQHPETAKSGNLPPGIDRVIYGEYPMLPIKADYVFVCRSSCWMPSWCDPQWTVLRKELEARRPYSAVRAPYVMRERAFERVQFQPMASEQKGISE